MTDIELIRACISGDKTALENFIARYSRLIYSAINSLLGLYGARGDLIPEDIFQELIVTLIGDNCRKLRTFEGRNGATLATWLRVVTVNFTLGKLRQRRNLPVSLDDEESPVDTPVVPPEDPERREALAVLTECVESLDPEERYFTELYLNQELTLNEMMMFLRVSRGAVDMRKQRLLQKLRECFKRKGFSVKTG